MSSRAGKNHKVRVVQKVQFYQSDTPHVGAQRFLSAICSASEALRPSFGTARALWFSLLLKSSRCSLHSLDLYGKLSYCLDVLSPIIGEG